MRVILRIGLMVVAALLLLWVVLSVTPKRSGAVGSDEPSPASSEADSGDEDEVSTTPAEEESETPEVDRFANRFDEKWAEMTSSQIGDLETHVSDVDQKMSDVQLRLDRIELQETAQNNTLKALSGQVENLQSTVSKPSPLAPSVSVPVPSTVVETPPLPETSKSLVVKEEVAEPKGATEKMLDHILKQHNRLVGDALIVRRLELRKRDTSLPLPEGGVLVPDLPTGYYPLRVEPARPMCVPGEYHPVMKNHIDPTVTERFFTGGYR